MMSERVGDLVCERAGPSDRADAPAIVFQHGLWAGSWIFSSWVRFAAERGWDAWAPNFRGRGGSRPVDELGRVSLADFAQDLRDVLSVTGPAVVVGYSMGGLVAQMVASEPNVKALVLLCSVPPRGIVGISGPVLRRSWRYIGAMARELPFAPSRADADAMTMNAMTASERDRWFPSFIADSGRAARQVALGAVAVDPRSVTCPTLVVSAQLDFISPPAIQPRLVSRYRGEHLPVSGHAHLIAIERGWEATADAILAWARGKR